ncbi:fluoride efflux transporter CrcB [Pseudolysinimonas sp.]|uniref:fluoride efflux transporter CrcB n=1 Tax=Pseudolysinimonas sp. TaxID=2680009 RepID=UPI003F80F546
MSPLVLLVVAVAGGVGSVLRFVVDTAITSRSRVRFPVGTNVINVSGSFLLGLLTGLASGGLLSPDLTLALGTGLLGGYTTFSTASLETVRLLASHRNRAAALNGLGFLALSVTIAAGGLALGRALV